MCINSEPSNIKMPVQLEVSLCSVTMEAFEHHLPYKNPSYEPHYQLLKWYVVQLIWTEINDQESHNETYGRTSMNRLGETCSAG